MSVLTIGVLFLLGVVLLILGFAANIRMLKILSFIPIVISIVQMIILTMMAL